jgi:hypothetical protein
MEYRYFNIMLPNGHFVKLLFKQYENNGDWICQMTEQFMNDLNTLLPISDHELSYNND